MALPWRGLHLGKKFKNRMILPVARCFRRKAARRLYKGISLLVVAQFCIAQTKIGPTDKADDDLTRVEKKLKGTGPSAISAAQTLADMGSRAQSAFPELVVTAKHVKQGSALQETIIYAIGHIAENAVRNLDVDDIVNSLPVLIDGLQSPATKTRTVAAYALGRLAPALRTRTEAQEVQQALSVLTGRASDPEPTVKRAVVEALGLLGQAAVFGTKTAPPVQAIASALRYSDLNPNSELQSIQIDSCAALGRFREAAGSAEPELALTLRDQNPSVQQAAAYALAQIGAPARPAAGALRSTLINGSSEVQKAAAYALARIRPDIGDTLPVLLTTLRDANPDVRAAAASASESFVSGMAAFPALIQAVADNDANVRAPVAHALGLVVENTAKSKDPNLIAYLEQSQEALQRALSVSKQGEPSFDEASGALDKVQAVLTQRRGHFLPRLWARHRVVSCGLIVLSIYSLAFLLLRFVFLPKWPLRILSMNEAIGPDREVEMPDWLLKARVPLKYFLLIGFFHYSSVVLDCWVDERLKTATPRFSKRDTVRDRRTYVPLPVMFEGRADPIPDISPEDLRNVCSEGHWCLRINGEGGLGKTTLACRIAIWAMEADPAKRLCTSRRMIPVLIEPGIGSQLLKGVVTLKEVILHELQDLSGAAEPIPQGLLDKLLRTGRILVILDGLSEMDDSADDKNWKNFNTLGSDLAISALLVTSRGANSLGFVWHSDMRPMRVDSNRLLPFMNAYLSQAKITLPDSELFDACRRLALLVGGERGITPLLARLYAEALIGFCRAGRPLGDLPSTVPDLILAYVNELNRKPATGRFPDTAVHFAAKCVAWECMAPRSGRGAPVSKNCRHILINIRLPLNNRRLIKTCSCTWKSDCTLLRQSLRQKRTSSLCWIPWRNTWQAFMRLSCSPRTKIDGAGDTLRLSIANQEV